MSERTEIRELESLGKLASGNTPSKSNPDYWNGTIPWITAKDLKSFEISTSLDKITHSAVINGAKLAPPGSVLILVRGMGLFKGIPVGLAKTELAFNQDVKAFVPNKGVEGRFVSYALMAAEPILRSGVTAAGHGTGRLNIDQLQLLPIRMPPLTEQHRIVSILDEWGDAIATAEKLLETRLRRKDAIRLGLFNGSLRLGNNTGEWSPMPLANLLRIREETSDGGETVCSVSVSRGLIDQIEHLGRSFAAANTGNYNRVCYGDIVYTKSPTGRFPLGIVKQSRIDEDVIVSPLYGVYVPISVAHGRLIDLYFSSPSAAEKYLAPFVHRGAKNTMAITDEGFLAGEIPMPSTQVEVDATGKLIQLVDNEINRLENYCKQLRLQKRGLLQKLLSGDLPVPSSIDRLLPGGQDIDEAVGAEGQRAEATG